MKYVSTRGQAPELNFGEVLMTGLAHDGGLYVPRSMPRFEAHEIANFAGMHYEEVALAVTLPFVGGFFSEAELKDLIATAYRGFRHTARAPLVQLTSQHFLLELFHGPTLAFKDFAMQLISQMMQSALSRSGQRVTIVGATSGDTGSAAIEAFRGLPNVDVFILYPAERVSEVQRRQMTTPVEHNVHALAIDGSFDDAQARVKDMFNDLAFRGEVGLAGVNSINWARIMAQVVYYFYAAVAVGAPHRSVSFTVPTGNFGDVFAGYVAKQMGLPVKRLVIATNQNDILDRALRTGRYITSGVQPSVSPSMDIQVASNFERALFDALGRDSAEICKLMGQLASTGGFAIPPAGLDRLRCTFSSGSASEQETLATIDRVGRETGELLCPHSAVGVKVASEHLGDEPMITLATASPAKFPETVVRATGCHPPLPPHMNDLLQRQERMELMPNDLAALKAVVLQKVHG